MECQDDYSHSNPGLMYFPRSFPTKSVEATLTQSPICCSCPDVCLQESCACLKQSGTFYRYSRITDCETYTLTYKNVNRPTYECNEQCGCINKLCGNKLIQCGPKKGLLVRTCEDSRKGEGVYTENSIKCGSFVCEYAGEVISETEASLRYKINAQRKLMNYIFCADEYFGEKNVKTFIDPSVYGNIGRYMNHSCDPNCLMVIARISENIPVLGLFACKDIEAGEELCYDYGIQERIDDLSAEELNMTRCLCGSDICNGYLPYDTRIL